MGYISCVVLAALSMSVVSAQYASCTDYNLTSGTNCTCSEVRNGKEIKCFNVNISISTVKEFDSVKLSCKDVISAPLTLPTLDIEEVNGLDLGNCLPTEVSIRDIMDHLGIDTFGRLTINGEVDSLAKGQLANLPNVVKLEGLGLKHIEQFIFVDQNTTESHITSLYLGRNNISHLDNTVFINLKTLWILNLSYNLLSTLPGDLFEYNNDLHDLHLCNNRLQNIPSELFRNQEKLKYLDISNNQLKHLEGEWRGLSRLVRLDISNNQLINPGDGKESMLRNIGMPLILNNNNLTRVNQDWLRGRKEVYLKYNNIQTLKINNLDNATKSYLFLEGNNITEVHIDVSESFKGWLVLTLKENPLICNCHLQSLARLSETHGRKSFNIRDINSTTCGSPPNLKGRLVKDLTLEELKCPVSEGPN